MRTQWDISGRFLYINYTFNSLSYELCHVIVVANHLVSSYPIVNVSYTFFLFCV